MLYIEKKRKICWSVEVGGYPATKKVEWGGAETVPLTIELVHL